MKTVSVLFLSALLALAACGSGHSNLDPFPMPDLPDLSEPAAWRPPGAQTGPLDTSMLFGRPEYPGEVRPLAEAVTIGYGLFDLVRVTAYTETTVTNGWQRTTMTQSLQFACKLMREGETIVATVTMTNIVAHGPDSFVAAARLFEGVTVKIVMNKDRELQHITIEGGRLADRPDSAELTAQLETTFTSLLAPLFGLNIRGRPIGQGSEVLDLADLPDQGWGKFPPIKSIARGRTEYWGRPALLAVTDYESPDGRTRVAGYQIIDIDSGLDFMSEALVELHEPGDPAVKARRRITVVEIR